MSTLYLVAAAVMGLQQPMTPVIPPHRGLEAPRMTVLQQQLPGLDALEGLEGLEGLTGLEGLAGLEGLQGLAGLEGLAALDGPAVLDLGMPALQDVQDPTDSLWRAARRAFNRGDYTAAANLYGDFVRRYPNASRAGDALYWGAFALYKNDNLERARSLIVTQGQQYPKAATVRDAATLLARIQTALAQQGDEDARRWLNQHALPDTTRSGSCPSEDDEDDMRVAALNGLLQMDAANAVPILKKVLARRDACSTALRRKAVFILSQKRGAETEDMLLDVARNDPDPEVRQQAVFWLSQVGSERAVSALDSILRTTGDAELREKALFSLSQIHNTRASQILRDYAGNERAPEDAREKAIFWLGQQRSPENAAFLRALYAKLTAEDLKEKVIFSLSQMGGTDNGRWLMDIALNEREPIEMRKKALFWAGQSGGDLSQLVELYGRMQNQEMKEQLIFVYSQRHEAAALDALIKIAKTEPDRELRKKAIFWLGQSHDPRAAQVLLEIINQ
ncbi:MAG TPA: HEAT repeat domain-containing protein [Gemmatimonadales bacterium]|nr:HEAT repeat domain-containing protein [Gemmatimonadales bacterium]